ncbi:cellulose synthase subunit BcsC-related outer membrane protein [Falsiroseomonas sp. CW058]|uniref:cellulose biosynthesis protein BcsC n=1 Tax=Falsiroseomonas sp. CW058 TaxID=3388664 RepID=UPI003D320952
MISFRSGLLASALVAAALVSGPVAAQERGIAALLDQANYWKLQNRPDQVVRTLERVLQSDPRNAEALAGIAEAQAQLGNTTQAQDALARLRNMAPADPRTTQADVAVRTATVDAGALAQARQLAQAGRNAEAVERYRALFRGQVPDSFALEYYQTLAGTEGGWREAREGLAQLARRAPTNTAVQLAQAQVLTYREETRAQGIEQLRRLSGQPDSQQSATAAWRQALTWIGPGPEAIRPLEGYLQQFPNDAEIQRRLEEARNPQPGADAAGDTRVAAWRAFNANRLREAEERFQAVLATDPNDADGLGGMGLIRLRQGRQADARRLLQAAIEADPARRASWERALQGASQRGGPAAPAGQAAQGGGGGAPGPDIQQARNLVEAGNFSQAEPLLGRILARNGGDRPDAEALLGDIALRQGNAGVAEQRYRAALARRGNFGAAMSGLASALQAQGKFAEAEEVFRRLGTVPQPQVRADALRAEAQRTDDPQAAAALLRGAIQSDPSNPWPRLDLARLLARSGQASAARQLIDESVAGRAPPDALHAAAIFANEQGRPADAVRLLERLPAGLRNADQNRMLASARVQAEVRAAASLATQGRRQEARTRLLAIASRPDPTGEAGPAVVRALNAMNDPVTAQQAARMNAIASRGQSPSAQLAAAGALMEAGLDQDAALRAQQIDAGRLTAEQRRTASNLQAGLAIRASDQLNRQGDQATAFEVLAPTLRQDPQNPAANLALARLYQGARETEQAQRVAEAVLSRNPRDTDARQAAMDAAIANRDWGRAEALLSEGRALMPNDPRIALLEARLARGWGDGRRAQAALQQAAQMRRQQLGLDAQPAPGILGGNMVPQATLPQQPTSYDNPFRRVPLSGQGGSPQVQPQLMQGQQFAQAMAPSAATPPDPLLNEITRQMQEVREEAAPRITPAFGLRTRSGDAGIDRLTETHAGAEGSIAMPGIGGRLTARASAVNADIGSLSQSLGSARRFGGNPLTLPGNNNPVTARQLQAATQTESSQSGVALGLAYSRPNFTVDIGTTPMGFNQGNVVGGIEIAPEISDGVRIRMTAERRAMMDSLLAWGGLRDPAFGREWGGVVRTGGRVQVEFASGETNFYLAGGYFRFDGEGVAENSRIEAGAGFQTPIWRTPTEELVTGLDIVYFAYDKNLRFFTLGHGGYFSPQSFISANIPLDYRGRSGNFTYRVGATLGLTTFTEDRTEVFPNDAGLQAQLSGLAAGSTGVDAFYPGQTKTGLTGGLRGDLEYMVTPQLRIGGALRFDQAADWSEARGIVYARYRFDR